MNIFLFIIPFVGALIGWISVYLAFFFIIYPKNPIKFGFYQIQGILPCKKNELVLLLSEHFNPAEILKGKADLLDFESDIDDLLDVHLDQLLLSFKKQNPMMSMFLTESMATKMKNQAHMEIKKMIPVLKQKIMDKTSEEFSIHDILAEKFQDEEILKSLYKQIFQKEIRKIAVIAALVGFSLGLFESLMGFLLL